MEADGLRTRVREVTIVLGNMDLPVSKIERFQSKTSKILSLNGKLA